MIVRLLLLMLLCVTGTPAWAQTATTIGTLTLTPTFDNIGVKLTYTGDSNTNNSATLQYRPSSGGSWRDAHTASVSTTGHWPDRRSTSNGISNTANQNQFRASILGVTAGTTYDIQLTLSDADGVTGTNPVTGSVTLLDPTTMVVKSGTTKYLDTNAAGGGDGSSGTPYNTWANAQSGTACGDTLIIKATSGASAGVTFSKSCTSTTWYKIECADQSVVAFSEGTGTTPNLTISGDYVQVYNCRFGASSDNNISLTTTPTNIWLDNNYFVDVLTAAVSAECGTARLYEGSIVVSSGSSNITITNNSINQLGTHAPCASNHSESSGRAIMFDGASSGGRHIIKGNTFTGKWADCIGNSPETQSMIFDNSDLLNNTFANDSCNDDSIQFEGSAINVRIGGNTITSSSNGLSCIAMQGDQASTTWFGPVYIYRNYCAYAGNSYAVKHGVSENVYWMHNTFKNTNAAGGVYTWGDSAGGTQTYMVLLNNIAQTNNGAAIQRMSSTGTTVNYNVLYRSGGGTPIVEEWNNTTTYNAISNFQSGASQCANCVGTNPSLDSSLHIDSGSVAYNAGVSIANVNDADSACPALNGAPDIGAYEVGGCIVGASSPGPRFSPAFLRRVSQEVGP